MAFNLEGWVPQHTYKIRYSKSKSNFCFVEHQQIAPEKSKAEAVEKRVKDIDVKEDVDALLNGEGDLSEEFKRKAATVFEAAVKSKVRDEIERIEEDYRNDLEENKQKTKDE